MCSSFLESGFKLPYIGSLSLIETCTQISTIINIPLSFVGRMYGTKHGTLKLKITSTQKRHGTLLMQVIKFSEG